MTHKKIIIFVTILGIFVILAMAQVNSPVRAAFICYYCRWSPPPQRSQPAQPVSNPAPPARQQTRSEPAQPPPPPPPAPAPAPAPQQSTPQSQPAPQAAPAAAAPVVPVVPAPTPKPIGGGCTVGTNGWIKCIDPNTGALVLPDCKIIQCGAGVGCIPPGRCYDCSYNKTCGNPPVEVSRAQAAAGQIFNFFCDPNNWGGCSVSCGGGTQTNACGGTRSCNTQACIQSWWQVKDGGATARGNVISNVPIGQTLATGTPSVVACGGSFCPTDAQVGAGNWKVDSKASIVIADRNSYPVFKARVGNKFRSQEYFGNLTSGRPAADGVLYWQAGGGVTMITAQNLGTNRAVLLADGNVDILGNLTFAEGGFLAILSGGDIKVNGTVTRLQGLYLAQGTFDTGNSALPLQVDGSVAGLTKVKLSRTYASGTTPAELFIYHPEYLTNLPIGLKRRYQFKQELVP